MNFDQVIDRQCSESLKWNVYEKDVIPLWVADMDFRAPQAVIDALHQRIDHGIFGYGLPPCDLGKIVVERMQRLFNWQVKEEEIQYVPGCVSGFSIAIRAFCQPGDAVLVQTPVYPPFLSVPNALGVKRVDNPLINDSNGHYTIDFDDFEQKIVENRVKLFILCNPHNPIGRIFSREELSSLAEICTRHEVTICSDEIHCDLIYQGHKHLPIASLNKETAAITITLMAPSKTYNIAGLHTSTAIIQNPDLAEKFHQSQYGLVGSPNCLGLVAARAAFLGGESWLTEVMTYLESNRDWLYTTILEKFPGIIMAKPEATFLAWLDCSALKLHPSPYAFFLEKAKVGLNEGKEFGPQAREYVRLNFASPRSILATALDRMHQALVDDGKIN